MTDNLLHLCEIRIVPLAQIPANASDLGIAALAESVNPENFVPGTASITVNQRNTSAGPAYSYEVNWSVPGMVKAADSERLYNIGALVLHTEQDQQIVLYRNDVFQNTPMKAEVSATLLRTQISFSFTTYKNKLS